MWVVIEEEGKFIPMGVGVMILFTTLQLQVKSVKLYISKVDRNNY
jgi:hypothetical protein